MTTRVTDVRSVGDPPFLPPPTCGGWRTTMAETGPRRDMSPIVREANEAALAGFETIGVATPEQINLVFRTVAKECKNQDERTLYLMTCKEAGLSPLKKQLYATRRSGELVFVTAYSVFVSRARRAGFVIHGECVCEGDQWEGWDAVNLAPVAHIIQKDPSELVERGNIVGAYAYATHVATGNRLHGGWWNWTELITDAGKIDRKDGFMWRQLPQHMTKRVAWLRVARMIAPDLDSLYGPEEFGHVIPDESDPESMEASAGGLDPIDTTSQVGPTDDQYSQEGGSGGDAN